MMEPQDKLDKLLFEYFDKTKDNIPVSTQNTINNALKSNRTTISIFDKIIKVAIIILSLLVATSGVALAVNIVKHIRNNYIVSTNALDTAIGNGYGQNIDMEFVYDNDIGVKVNYIVMDEKNLNIEYEYNVKNRNNISCVSIDEYIIRDENNNIIYYYFNDRKVINLPKKIANNSFRNEYREETLYKENILYVSSNFPRISNLIFEITQISIDNEKVQGTWIFEINIDNKIVTKEKDNYISTYSEYIHNITAVLNKTSLNIEIELNTHLSSDMLLEPDNIVLTDNADRKYRYNIMKDSKNGDHTIIFLQYDIGNYDSKEFDILKLFIRFDTNKIIDIKLRK